LPSRRRGTTRRLSRPGQCSRDTFATFVEGIDQVKKLVAIDHVGTTYLDLHDRIAVPTHK
jgi:hypothetical protein